MEQYQQEQQKVERRSSWYLSDWQSAGQKIRKSKTKLYANG